MQKLVKYVKTALLQLTNKDLLLTPVHSSGGSNVFSQTQKYELPAKLQDGHALQNVQDLALFVNTCMRGTDMLNSPVIFCLEDSHVVTKEIKHFALKAPDLLKAARMEAETVLHDNIDNYVIAVNEYNRDNKINDTLKSMVYAVPAALMQSLQAEFRQHGIRVEKVMPPIAGLMNSCKTVLKINPTNSFYLGKTVAVVDLSREKTRMILFKNGTPIFQQEFEAAYPEILQTIHKIQNIPEKQAADEMQRSGFLLSRGEGHYRENVVQNIGASIDASVSEIVRSLRTVLISEQLKLNQIYFCGPVCSHPDFHKFLQTLSLPAPAENVTCEPQRLGIVLDSNAVKAGVHVLDFFTLNGLITAKGNDNINFLSEENNRLSNRRINILFLGAITAAAVASMAIEPILYATASYQQRANKDTLSSPPYQEVSELLKEKSELQSMLDAAKNDQTALQKQKSSTEEILSKVQEQIAPRVKEITSCQVDNQAGTVTLGLNVGSMNDFNSLRQSVENAGYFSVTPQFTVSLDDTTKLYKCTSVLAVKNFSAASSSTEGSASK